jgi:hypothetical protein
MLQPGIGVALMDRWEEDIVYPDPKLIIWQSAGLLLGLIDLKQVPLERVVEQSNRECETNII